MLLEMKFAARSRAGSTMENDSHDGTGRPRLLLAYADPAYASRVARAFRRLGWEVHMAAGALEACRQAEIYRPQVVLLDLDLPEASGWETCAQLTTAQHAMRVILLARDEPADRDDALRRSGAAALILRSARFEELVRAAYEHALTRAM